MLESLHNWTRIRHRLKVGWLTTIALILVSCNLQSQFVAAYEDLLCDDVAFMPDEILATRSLDTVQNYTDVHIFQRYFTYQVPHESSNHAKPQDASIMHMKFDPRKKSWEGENSPQQSYNSYSGGDLMLRLRASFRAPRMDSLDQGMKISILEEDTGKVIIEGSSEDDDERSVHLDSTELSSEKAYVLQYEFFEKSVTLDHEDDVLVSGGHMGAMACNQPFIIQELAIVSKELVKDRVNHYLHPTNAMMDVVEGRAMEHDLSEMTKNCDLTSLNNVAIDKIKGDHGLYCSRLDYTYPMQGYGQQLNTIYEKQFQVQGAGGESVLYLLDVTIGYDFVSSAQLKALVRRVNPGEIYEYTYNPLKCLYDHSCFEAEQLSKNELNINVILTVGTYELIIFDMPPTPATMFVANEAQLSRAPFTFELQATPIIQNEDRQHCKHRLFLHENFIQNRFLEGKGGRRFTFDEDMLISFAHNAQKIFLKPEIDMILKVSTKEAYGINMAMKVCKKNDMGGSGENCPGTSTQTGNSEMLFAQLDANVEYYLTLEHTNSIIQLSSFFDCPHVRLRLSMMNENEYQALLQAQRTNVDSPGWLQMKKQESETHLQNLLDQVSKLVDAQNTELSPAGDGTSANYVGPEGEHYFIPEKDIVYTYPTLEFDGQGVDSHSTVLTEKHFTIPKGTRKEVFLELYYDPQFYVLEALIENKDAHLFGGGQSSLDLTKYKGSKRIMADFEEGEYVLKIIGKHAGNQQSEAHFHVKYFEFQIYMVISNEIINFDQYPNSLNLLGMLNPEGKGYGQFTYIIPNLDLYPATALVLYFKHTGRFDIQVIDEKGRGDLLSISVVDAEADKQKDTNVAGNPYPYREDLGVRFIDDDEEGVTYKSLVGQDQGKNQKMIVRNDDLSQTVVGATIKIIFTETDYIHPGATSARKDLPGSFDEIVRTKPKVMGLKESSFIQGSSAVMDMFDVNQVEPFTPKSDKVYTASYKLGPGSDDDFMPSLDFEVTDNAAEFYMQITCYDAEDDLFATLVSLSDDGDAPQRVARTDLGKYANSIGPVMLTKGWYRMIIHPDLEGDEQTESRVEVFRFGIDVLLEKTSVGSVSDVGFQTIVQSLELCNLPTLPNDFNGPGLLNRLAGNTLQITNKYRVSEILDGGFIKFDLPEASLVTVYIEMPESLQADSLLERVNGDHETLAHTKDLNKYDETFLRQQGGYNHRGVIQLREFLDAGPYQVKVQASEKNQGTRRVQPRCEPYTLSLSITPLRKLKESGGGCHIGETCLNEGWLPEHLEYDSVESGTVTYPMSDQVVDVAYINLNTAGTGPFMVFFQIQADPRIEGVLGLSLSNYDVETITFKQASLYGSPQDGLTEIFTVVPAGVYAIGIQTLSSSRSPFKASGLSANTRNMMQGKLLHEPCLKVGYTYLIASANKHETQVLHGGLFDLIGMMFGGGMPGLGAAVATKSRDETIIEEMGSMAKTITCEHDDLSVGVIRASEAYDREFNLVIQTKPSDDISLVIDRDSLIRFGTHSKNDGNQIKGFLYNQQQSLIESSHGGRIRGGFAAFLTAAKKPYRLEIDYAEGDERDSCPKVNTRIAVKTIENVIEENYRCLGNPMPMNSLVVDGTDVSISGDYAFPLSTIKKIGGDEWWHGMEYDILIDWHGAEKEAEYDIDIEITSDFLTGQIGFVLLYENKAGRLVPLARGSQQFNKLKEGPYTMRMKWLEHAGKIIEEENLEHAVLRLQIPATSLKQMVAVEDSHKVAQGADLCMNFGLWFRAERLDKKEVDMFTSKPRPTLMRVRWEGTKVGQRMFDQRQRLTAILEFDNSFYDAWGMIKTDPKWAELEPVKTTAGGSVRIQPKAIAASVAQLDVTDSSQVILTYHAGSLARGWCFALKLNNGVPPQFEASTALLDQETDVCMSNCLCDPVGTHQCIESSGVCQCREPHTGRYCEKCGPGFIKDVDTGSCIPQGLCESKGGDVDCNGHGTCEQRGLTAVCHCDSGFEDDGADLCGRCSDPMFTYPDCKERKISVHDGDISCTGLPHRIPIGLYEGSKAHKDGDPLQDDDGVLKWAARYRLAEAGSEISEAESFFIAPAPMVFRLFIDTVHTGALVRYRLLNYKNEEILSSDDDYDDADGFTEIGQEIVILKQPHSKSPENAPYQLQLEFEHEGITDYGDQDTMSSEGGLSRDDEWLGDYTGGIYKEDDSCPAFDIRLLVEPLTMAQQAIKCSPLENSQASQSQTSHFDFGQDSQIVSQSIVLRSDDEYVQQAGYDFNGKPTTVMRRDYQITITQPGSALSIVATYPFSEMQLSMFLLDSDGALINVDTTGPMEDTEHMEKSKHDMAAYIEESSMDEGTYTLSIEIPKAYFLPTKDFNTCLGFGLNIEYIHRTNTGNTNYQRAGLPQAITETTPFDVISIRPPILLDLDMREQLNIKVALDRDFTLTDIAKNVTLANQVCQLVSEQDSNIVVSPIGAKVEHGTILNSHFNFARPDSNAKEGMCYNLRCSTRTSLVGKPELINILPGLHTRYCIQSEAERLASAPVKCNPRASAKLDGNGNCICSSPYTGNDCESCVAGFTQTKKKLWDSHDGVAHTVCSLDTRARLSRETCNNHGEPTTTTAQNYEDIECRCDQRFDGKFCDVCEDPTLAYPDCQDVSAKIYDPRSIHDFLQRGHYDMNGYSMKAAKVFPHGALEPRIFNEECGWVDLPDNLDRLEYGQEFYSSEFHIADVYTVNHKQDNVIKFRPKEAGTFKIALQQPSDLESDEATFDLEVGLYDPQKQRFIAQAMNSHYRLPAGTTIKMEHATLSYEVPQSLVGKNLYVFFRALNFTDEDGANHRKSDGCLALFMEIEFRAAAATCFNDPMMRPEYQITSLREDTQSNSYDFGNSGGSWHTDTVNHTINDPHDTFFTYQDFYIEPASQPGDMDLTISVLQKFHERNTIDFLIEILQYGAELNQINKNDYPEQAMKTGYGQVDQMTRREAIGRTEDLKGIYGPACEKECIVGGEKSYNENKRVITLPQKTYVRVWLMQQVPPDRESESKWCANYQFVTRLHRSLSDTQNLREVAQSEHCMVEDLPDTLNQPRYLDGAKGQQKDFNYRQSYRVDHLWHNLGHKIDFHLQENTVVRVFAPIHHHLDYELILNEKLGPYSSHILIEGVIEDQHTGFFAQLKPGDYEIQLAFTSDANLLQIPCQTVQLEIAMMTVANVRKIQNAHASIPGRDLVNQLDIAAMIEGQTQVLYKPAGIQLYTSEWLPSSTNNQQAAHQSNLQQLIYSDSLTFEEEDEEAGIDIELNSDFLLSAVNIVVRNAQTGRIVSDERREGSARVIIPKLTAGTYTFEVYTHKCVSNIPSDYVNGFDLLLDMSARTMRLSDGHKGQVNAVVHRGRNGQSSLLKPWVVTRQELDCMDGALPFGSGALDPNNIETSLDFNAKFFLPHSLGATYVQTFQASSGQTALRILLAYSNSKVSLSQQGRSGVLAESVPHDNGASQFLIAENLTPGYTYNIHYEFSARDSDLDGQGALGCETFMLEIMTFASEEICADGIEKTDATNPMYTSPGADETIQAIRITKSKKSQAVTVSGDKVVDMLVTLDYSETIFKPWLTVTVQNPTSQVSSHPELVQRVQAIIADETSPDHVDFSRKNAVVYLFENVHAGSYNFEIHQSFKKGRDNCQSTVGMHIQSWESGRFAMGTDKQSFGSLHMYQSADEDNERPRQADRFPLDLSTYKFLGGEPKLNVGEQHTLNMLFSGPVQLNERDEDNFVRFNVYEDRTFVRFYMEKPDITLTLERLVSGNETHPTNLGSYSQSLAKIVSQGQYRVKFRAGSQTTQANHKLLAPKSHLTIAYAQKAVEEAYKQSWNGLNDCEGSKHNFPLALRQQRQADVHSLYYDYPVIKVDPAVMRGKEVLQTYNFRANVTSRAYFEVGSHLIARHTALIFSSLGNNVWSVSGKQRGNLNSVDVELPPGDYQVQVVRLPKSFGMDTDHFGGGCGLFSLQGVVEGVNLMSKEQSSGQIVQKGLTGDHCTDYGDVLPMQIYRNQAETKSGGEIHVDQMGLLTKKFRDVVFKTSLDPNQPEYDRIELDVEEDSFMHLTFTLPSRSGMLEIDVVLQATAAFGAPEVQPMKAFLIPDVAGDVHEQVFSYKLQAGTHYALNIFYYGKLRRGGRARCAYYDLSMSITHMSQMAALTPCKNDKDTPSMANTLPEIITDSDLNSKGVYKFNKMMRLKYPDEIDDFDPNVQLSRASRYFHDGTLSDSIIIDLSKNFDIEAKIEYQYDQAMYALKLEEVEEGDDSQELLVKTSHRQEPLEFMRNDDKQRSVVRTLVADDVDSVKEKRKHILMFQNMQPEMLKNYKENMKDFIKADSQICLYTRVEFVISSVGQSKQEMFAEHYATSGNPFLMAVDPHNSPVFLHGRPTTINFDLAFTSQPYVKRKEKTKDPLALRSLMKVKLELVNMKDGVKSTVMHSAANVYNNEKHYNAGGSNTHVTAVFDLTDIQKNPYTRVLHAQLDVPLNRLVDEEGRVFGIEEQLKARGLPIYVFEDTDAVTTVQDEGGRVKQALEGEELAYQADRMNGLDIGRRFGDLETATERAGKHKTYDSWGEEADETDVAVPCLCIHGSCDEGSSGCSGACDDGWTGRYCDVPKVSDDQLSSMRRSSGSKPSSRMSHGTGPQIGRATKIEDDDWGAPINPPTTELVQTPDVTSTPVKKQGEATPFIEQAGMVALVIGFCYFLCPYSMNDIQLPFLQRPAALQGGPGPNYRPISSAEGFNYDSGDDEMPETFKADDDNDPAGRGRPLELQSFNANVSSQPVTSQPRDLPKRNPVEQQQPDYQQPQVTGEDELARELEEFADDDEQNLLELGDRQPQNNDDDINQLENYFDNYN